MKTINFNNQYVPQNSLEIESVGNVCIKAINDEGYYFYLLTKTTLGTTSMFEYGPVDGITDKLQSPYSILFQRISFNEKKLETYF